MVCFISNDPLFDVNNVFYFTGLIWFSFSYLDIKGRLCICIIIIPSPFYKIIIFALMVKLFKILITIYRCDLIILIVLTLHTKIFSISTWKISQSLNQNWFCITIVFNYNFCFSEFLLACINISVKFAFWNWTGGLCWCIPSGQISI